MKNKIDQKIVGYNVKSTEEQPVILETSTVNSNELLTNVVQMHESVVRPERLVGSSYKIKPPGSEHAMYVTVNDIVLNEGTEHEARRPFEVFINSKNMEHFQWVVALTRLISAVFRKGGDATFLVEELKAVFDPKGGYFKGGGVFMPSLVAEIGHAIEDHMKRIGMINTDVDEHQKAYIEQKRQEIQDAETKKQDSNDAATTDSGFPESASLCIKCSTKALILMDGCMTCLSCGDSKCG